jgi:hypothetical protein
LGFWNFSHNAPAGSLGHEKPLSLSGPDRRFAVSLHHPLAASATPPPPAGADIHTTAPTHPPCCHPAPTAPATTLLRWQWCGCGWLGGGVTARRCYGQLQHITVAFPVSRGEGSYEVGAPASDVQCEAGAPMRGSSTTSCACAAHPALPMPVPARRFAVSLHRPLATSSTPPPPASTAFHTTAPTCTTSL